MLTKKEIKLRHFKKIYDNASTIKCSCGCGQILKNKDKYGRDKFYINGHNNRKYQDPTQYKREWNHRNREQRYIYKKKRYQRRKGQLIILKGGECKECKLLYNGSNASVFDFHHLKDKKLSLNVRNIGDKPWKVILKEARKCELLCSNCHRLKTSGEY